MKNIIKYILTLLLLYSVLNIWYASQYPLKQGSNSENGAASTDCSVRKFRAGLGGFGG